MWLLVSRDIRHVKTPPAGVAAQLAAPVKDDDWGEPATHPGEPLLEVIARRTKHASSAVSSVDHRLSKLEVGQDEHGKVITSVRIAVAGLDGKVDTLLEATLADRAEREARRQAALDHEKLEHEARLKKIDRLPLIIKAAGVAIAAIVGAVLGGYLR
jgi:hypothetical protein